MELSKALGESTGNARRMAFLSWLGGRLKKRYGTRAVVVGGTAAEFYSSSMLATFDIDVIYANAGHIDAILLGEGFQKRGRYWMNDDLDVTLEAPDHTLDGDIERVVSVRVSDDEPVHIIGLEDLVVDRLEQYAFGGARECLEQAYYLLDQDYPTPVDAEYLAKRLVEINGLKGKLAKAPLDVVGKIEALKR